MDEKVRSVQDELESRGKNKQDVHAWIREQKGQPDDIHEWIALQNQTKSKSQEKNK